MNDKDVRQAWADRSGEFSPTYYAHRGPDAVSEAVRAILDRHLGPDASVLELGCSAGRHLAHLHEHGYRDLAGVELNGQAFEVMAETFPDLADIGTFHHDSIEAVVEAAPDDAYDAVYSVETLQHVHPDASWVFDELARITGDLLVTVENEDGAPDAPEADDVNYVSADVPLFYRDWEAVFTERGFRALPVDAAHEIPDRNVLRAFEPI